MAVRFTSIGLEVVYSDPSALRVTAVGLEVVVPLVQPPPAVTAPSIDEVPAPTTGITITAPSVQQYAPVELYKFFWGNGSGAGSSQDGVGGTAPTSFWEDFESYNAPTEMDTAGWVYSAGDFVGVTRSIGSGNGGGAGVMLEVPAGTQLGHIGPTQYIDVPVPAYYDSSGVPIQYTIKADMKLDAGFTTDAHYWLYGVGVFNSPGGLGAATADFGPEPAVRTSNWQTLQVEDIARAGTTASPIVRVTVGWGFLGYFTTYHDATIQFDNVRVLAPGETDTPPITSGPGQPLVTQNWTTADVPIVYNGETYLPLIGHRTNLASGSGERTASEFDLSVPFDHPVAELAKQGVPRGPIGYTMFRLDRSDLTQAIVPSRGQITRHRIEGRWCILTLGNVGTLLNRKLPRMLTQRHCPHVFGGPFCQRALGPITYEGCQVTAAAGRIVVVEGASVHASANNNPTFFEEGVLTTTDGLLEFIENQSGDTLTLKAPVPGLDEGNTVTLQGGCKHTAQACDLHANIAHFGGEIGMPDRNPFSGTGLSSPGSGTEA